jgi:hypothetical protein
MAISSSIVAGAVLIAAGAAALFTPWVGGNRSTALVAGTTAPSAVVDCAAPPLTVATASGRSFDALFTCAAGIARVYSNASWEAFARSFSQ